MTPGSPEWMRLITASKVAAILGISPWESPYSLWRRMRGDIPADTGNENTRRGHYLEPAILAWWRDQHDVPEMKGIWQNQPTYKLGDWAAATPDVWVDLNWNTLPEQPVLVEAKSAASDDDWGVPGTDAIPDYYLVQCQWQMHVSGIHRCYVPVLTSRLRFVEYVVDYDPQTAPVLEARMRTFYDSLTADVPPDLDDTVMTYEAIKAVSPNVDKGVEIELPADLARDLVTTQATYKDAETRVRGLKSRVIERMGTAQYATSNGVRIARRQGNDGSTFVVVAKPDHLIEGSDAA